MLRLIAIVTAALMLGASAHAADEIKLGILASLTGSLSPPGQEGKRGMDIRRGRRRPRYSCGDQLVS